MQSKYINAILSEIGSNLTCKKCGHKISMENVALAAHDSKAAHFDIICDSCGTLMKVSAEVTAERQAAQKKEKVNSFEFEITDTVTTSDDLTEISRSLKGANTFSSFFALAFLLLIPLFSSCEKSSEEVRAEILNGIETAKEKSNQIYEEGKKLTSSAATLIEEAPAKIEQAQKEAEQMLEDAKKAKEDLEETYQKSKEALEKAQKAVDAVGEAVDAVNEITGTGSKN